MRPRFAQFTDTPKRPKRTSQRLTPHPVYLLHAKLGWHAPAQMREAISAPVLPLVFSSDLSSSSGPASGNPESVHNGTVLRLVFSHHIGMKMRDLTLKQLSSVPCPTCGVASGERCLLHSGGPRSEPHLDRKLVAAEAIEQIRIPHGPGRR
jgi:hypothetical protein